MMMVRLLLLLLLLMKMSRATGMMMVMVVVMVMIRMVAARGICRFLQLSGASVDGRRRVVTIASAEAKI